MEAIKHFLSSETLNSATFFLIDDDGDVDSSGTIYALRNIFDVVCPLGDALILARRNPWHNMNKTIFNEFISQWEQAIMLVKEKKMDGFLSDSTWLQAMWLHVIVDGYVHYTTTHLHEDSDGLGHIQVAPVKVVLKVGDATCDSIKSEELEMGSENWTPEDFIKSAFNKLQAMMEGKPNNYYVFGHCCPEQAIVSMAKSGISPLATCRNKFSCGHGMYFFKLDHAALQLSFDELHHMAHDSSRVLNPSGVSVLVFITCSDFQPLDTTVDVLPLCNDGDTPDGWKCNCKSSLLSISADEVESDTSWPLLTTNAICTAISTINREDIEKINAFALLGGIVDFDRISSGVYTSVIMDNNLEIVTDSLKNIPKWSDASKYKVWRDIIKEKSSYFRRPTTYFNHKGGFLSLSKPGRQQLKNKPEHWSDCPLNPIQETVFVNDTALSKLLVEADQVYVIFLRPDAAFLSRRTAVAACFNNTETPMEISFQNDVCLIASENDADKDLHLYWKNRNRCRVLNCCKGCAGSSGPSELENNLPKMKSSPLKQCYTTQEQLYKYYPDLKPHDPCPCCEVKIGLHANPRPKSLSGAPHLEGTGLDSDVYLCSTNVHYMA
eukprot:gene30259-39477_t